MKLQNTLFLTKKGITIELVIVSMGLSITKSLIKQIKYHPYKPMISKLINIGIFTCRGNTKKIMRMRK